MYFAKKFLHELSPGTVVESAAFVHNETLHYCVPSQTGCNIGCIMCATTYDNHASGKGITFENYQLILNRLDVESNHINLDKVLSFSGHGEPGLNQHVISQFIANNIKKFSEIHLTTILPKNSIDFFLNLKLVALYISLHEVSDEARSQIIPKGNILNITDIINFAEIFSKNNGKVTFNYLLLDTNTTKSHAKALIRILDQTSPEIRLRLMTLSPLNGITSPVQQPSQKKLEEFIYEVLTYGQANRITTPKLEGVEVGLACGQLRAYYDCLYTVKKSDNG